jgi:acetoin utilization deacetylase AcuC-like enzyme
MIPVFYVPAMTANDAESFSPSAGKPAQVVADWRMNFDIAPEIEFFEFEPVTPETLALAHDPAYVAGVLSGRVPNGFGGRSPAVAASLPYTTGSLLAAARHVLQAREDWPAVTRIACSPSSGFHHAHYGEGGAYCTFNGLMVTALALKAEGLVDRVLILDCDQHFGDGTQNIIDELGVDWVLHVTHGGRLRGSYRDPSEMHDRISQFMADIADPSKGRGVVLYQAGADCHVDDPLGGFLTTEEMRERDRQVFWLAQQHRVPLVWNLAGGYLRDERGSIAPVVALHRQTMIEAIIAWDQGCK